MISHQIVRTTLPSGFPELEADASDDGHRHIARFAEEFERDRAMFHAIVASHSGRRLIGIGAITDEPEPTPVPAWRMRRLYIHRDFRRRGAARSIAVALLREAAKKTELVTVHAGNDGAARFWEAIGFTRVRGHTWSHMIAARQFP